MGIVTSLIERFRSSAKPSPTDEFWYTELTRAINGKIISPEAAQRISAAYACQTAIAESVSMLPAIVYEDIDGATKRIKEHWTYQLLRDQPHPAINSFDWFETMQESALNHGNAYAHKLLTKSGRITRLTPMPAEKIEVQILPSGYLGYTYHGPDGPKLYSQHEMFHLKYKSKDGLKGRSPVSVCADAFGFAQSLQTHGNNLFENGAFLSGFITAPVAFKTKEAREGFMESFKQIMGARNSGKFGLLEQGTGFTPYSMNNRDAQFLENWNASVLEIARLYRVIPVMIGVTESGMSYTSIEQLGIMWVQYTIQPWATRWERAFKSQLFGNDPELYMRFNLSALLRGDLKTRTEAVVQQIQYGLKTINEGRNLLDEERIDDPGADAVLVSHNLRPISTVFAAETPVETPPETPAPTEIQPQKPELKQFMPLFTDLMRRNMVREQKGLAKEREKGTVDAFAEKQRRAMAEVLLPAVTCLCAEPERAIEGFSEMYFKHRDYNSELSFDETEISKWADRVIQTIEVTNASRTTTS